MEQTAVARVLFAAPASGSGKTTVVCAIMEALRRRGLKLAACKCGPDYIDPLFHRAVLGIPSQNIDLFLLGKRWHGAAVARRLVAEAGADTDITVIEGAMGYYDGIGTSESNSAYAVRAALAAPAVLIVDGRGAALSLAATLRGFVTFRRNSGLQGFILNHVKPSVYTYYRQVLEEETGLKAYGYLPELPDCTFASRHLGLVTAGEIEDLQATLGRLAQAAEEGIDLDGLLQLAAGAPPLNWCDKKVPQCQPVRLAVADDEAFCFYYAAELDLFRKLGAEIIPFSPIHDAALPDCDALYLGGGYPELHAPALTANASMRQSICTALADGLPCLAECGGFMYLQESYSDGTGSYPWVGALPGSSHLTQRLVRFGYITVTAEEDTLLGPAGTTFRAHEFHYSDSTANGTSCTARKASGTRSWPCIQASPTLFAGYPHLNLTGHPEQAARFLHAAAAYAAKRGASREN